MIPYNDNSRARVTKIVGEEKQARLTFPRSRTKEKLLSNVASGIFILTMRTRDRRRATSNADHEISFRCRLFLNGSYNGYYVIIALKIRREKACYVMACHRGNNWKIRQ